MKWMIATVVFACVAFVAWSADWQPIISSFRYFSKTGDWSIFKGWPIWVAAILLALIGLGGVVAYSMRRGSPRRSGFPLESK